MKSNCLSWFNENDCAALVRVLKNGGVALGPSDTIIGLLVAANLEGVSKLNRIKQRVEKPYIILVDSLEKISRFGKSLDSFHIEKIMRNCWPGPVTLIFHAQPRSPVYAGFVQKTVAIRIPAHRGLLNVLAAFDGLLSTSANKAGELVPPTMSDVDPDLLRQVDCCVDGQGLHMTPSTILDCTGDDIVVVREGAYPVAQLERIAGKPFLKS